MGNGPSNRRNGRIAQNPGPAPPSWITPPSGYPSGHAMPTPGPANYPVSSHHMSYYYPPNYNGAIPTSQYYQQPSVPNGGHYVMNLLSSQGHRPQPSLPAQPPPPTRIPEIPEQKATTIRNDVNLQKKTLHLEKDEENPGYFLVTFTFDALVAGSVCIFFLAKEGPNRSMMALKPTIFMPVRIHFEKGLGQKFRQAPGTGVMLALFDEKELLNQGDDVFPLVVRTETISTSRPVDVQPHDQEPLGAPLPDWVHSQTTHADIEMKDDETYQVRVVSQTIWYEGMSYEVKEIYGIDNSLGGEEVNGDDFGKECVICLSEPRDTAVMPCRHMCMCRDCAKVLRIQTSRCPICRTPVTDFLEIKVSKNKSVDEQVVEGESSNFRLTSGEGASDLKQS